MESHEKYFVILICILFVTTLVAVHNFGINNAAALMPKPPETINGTYQDNYTGFSVELPEDWSGKMEYNPMLDLNLFGSVTHGHVIPASGDGKDTTDSSTVQMQIVTYDNDSIEIIKRHDTNPDSIDDKDAPDNMSLEMVISQIDKDSNVILKQTHEFLQRNSILDNPMCYTLSEKFTTVNNATGKEFTKKCQTTSKGLLNLKKYLFSTKDDSLIEISYVGPFTNQSDIHYDQFIQSVNTLKIFNPVDIRNSQIYDDYLKYVVDPEKPY